MGPAAYHSLPGSLFKVNGRSNSGCQAKDPEVDLHRGFRHMAAVGSSKWTCIVELCAGVLYTSVMIPEKKALNHFKPSIATDPVDAAEPHTLMQVPPSKIINKRPAPHLVEQGVPGSFSWARDVWRTLLHAPRISKAQGSVSCSSANMKKISTALW